MTAPARPRHGERAPEAPTPSWRERLAALRHLPPLLRLVWETHRGYTIATLVLRIAASGIPVATLWIGKLIVDEVVRLARAGGGDLDHLWALVATEIGIVVMGEALSRASWLVDALLGDLFGNRMSVRIMEHAATLDLAQFEDPTFYDHLERARRHTTGRVVLLSQLTSIGQGILTLVSLGTALVVFQPLLLVLVLVAVLPTFFGEAHFAARSYSLLFRRTPERRQLDYIRWVGATSITAKEVQLFGLAPWLIDRYRVLSTQFYEENARLSVKRAVVATLLGIWATLAYYGAYATIIVATVRGTITLGTLTFLSGTFKRSHDQLGSLFTQVSGIYEQALYLKDLFVFLEMKPTITSRPGARPVPRPIREGFVFEDVGFRYPGGDRWAVRHVNLHLRPGERVALVGENGAGKTTLTKLLARLYDPSEGRILLDGVDLREFDLVSLRRNIGVIFQDFVRYDMRFDENVGVGEIEEVKDYLAGGAWRGEGGENGKQQTVPAPPTTIVSASERSLASSLLPRLPGGYGQMLGRRFDEGVDLSGGEWQKVALARAYMRDAQLLILDEPTAALDARAEFEVFERFAALMRDRMAVVISHRFSTVRMADRIVVLQHGHVLEEGTHEQLVAAGGLYAELFAMQAAGYR